MKGKFVCVVDTGAGTCRVANHARVNRQFHESVELVDGDGAGVSKAEAEAYCAEFFARGERIAADRAGEAL